MFSLRTPRNTSILLQILHSMCTSEEVKGITTKDLLKRFLAHLSVDPTENSKLFSSLHKRRVDLVVSCIAYYLYSVCLDNTAVDKERSWGKKLPPQTRSTCFSILFLSTNSDSQTENQAEERAKLAFDVGSMMLRQRRLRKMRTKVVIHRFCTLVEKRGLRTKVSFSLNDRCSELTEQCDQNKPLYGETLSKDRRVDILLDRLEHVCDRFDSIIEALSCVVPETYHLLSTKEDPLLM